jgi:hypothetical protein
VVNSDLIKLALLKGFDDGVTTMDSMMANPNPAQIGPSMYVPIPSPANARVFDMGVAKTSLIRAMSYYLDQTVDGQLGSAGLAVSAGAVPSLSPSGMVQPVLIPALPLRDSRSRYGNHYSLIMSASDHFWGPLGNEGETPSHFTPPDYRYQPTVLVPTTPPFIQEDHNGEETFVVTDPAIYQVAKNRFFTYPCRIVNPGISNLVEERTRGKSVTFSFKIFGHRFTKTWWIWKRKYHWLNGTETKTECDYMYEYVLQ